MTFAAFVAGIWRRDCHDRCKPSTRATNDCWLRNQLLPNFGVRELRDIAPADVSRWFDAYAALRPGGANRALDVLRQILAHAVLLGHAERNPAAHVRHVAMRVRTRFLSLTEIRRLLDDLAAHAARSSGGDQADVIRLLLYTGMRKREAMDLRWSEVGDGRIHLRDAKTGPRTVVLSAAARALLDRRPRAGERVFPACAGKSELSLWRKVRPTGVRLHDLRHTFASHLAIRGTPVPVIARLLGHATPKMSLRYAHLSDSAVILAASDIGGSIAADMHLAGTAG